MKPVGGLDPWLVFGGLLFYYMVLTMTWDYKKLLGYVDFRLIAWVAIIIIMANFAREHTNDVKAYLEGTAFDINTVQGFATISAIAFASAFAFGSSSRFAAITTILSLVYGVEYFVWFFALDYAGYLISPMHKCMAIGKMYFGTPWKRYFNALGSWIFLLVGAGAVTLIV